MASDKNKKKPEVVTVKGKLNLPRNYYFVRYSLAFVNCFVIPPVKMILMSAITAYVFRPTDEEFAKDNPSPQDEDMPLHIDVMRRALPYATSTVAMLGLLNGFYYLLGNAHLNEFTSLERFGSNFFVLYMIQFLINFVAYNFLSICPEVQVIMLVVAALEIFCMFAINYQLKLQIRLTRKWQKKAEEEAARKEKQKKKEETQDGKNQEENQEEEEQQQEEQTEPQQEGKSGPNV